MHWRSAVKGLVKDERAVNKVTTMALLLIVVMAGVAVVATFIYYELKDS